MSVDVGQSGCHRKRLCNAARQPQPNRRRFAAVLEESGPASVERVMATGFWTDAGTGAAEVVPLRIFRR
jgi:hypothetical protein